MRRLALLDDAPPTAADRAANWILGADDRAADAPAGRARLCAAALAELNEHCAVDALDGDAWWDAAATDGGAAAARGFDVIVAADEYGARSSLATRAARVVSSRRARAPRSSPRPRFEIPIAR